MKAYHFNHWLLSLHEFKYLHYSVTFLSMGRNNFFGVCSDLDIKKWGANQLCSQWSVLLLAVPEAVSSHTKARRTTSAENWACGMTIPTAFAKGCSTNTIFINSFSNYVSPVSVSNHTLLMSVFLIALITLCLYILQHSEICCLRKEAWMFSLHYQFTYIPALRA